MGIIHFEDIQAGMVLNSDLKDRNSRILLKAGTPLAEKHLRILKMWGILEADIQGVEKETVVSNMNIEIDPILQEKVEIELSQQFCHTNRQHPFINELFRLLTLRKVFNQLRNGHHD
jgi:hypothetical protein